MSQNRSYLEQTDLERNPALRIAIMEIVENQLRDKIPPETKQAYERLVREGYSENQAREFIAAAVTDEINEVMQRQEPFNQARFARALKRLPELLKEE